MEGELEKRRKEEINAKRNAKLQEEREKHDLMKQDLEVKIKALVAQKQVNQNLESQLQLQKASYEASKGN